MHDQQRRFGRREMATAAAAATILPGTLVSGLTGTPQQAAAAPLRQGMPTPLADQTLAYVSGHGSVRLPPDIASAIIGIEVERPTLAEAQAEATARASAIMLAIEAAGVAKDDIGTARFNVRVVREREKEREGKDEREEEIRFQISNSVEVTVRDLDMLGQVLDDAIAAGANAIGQIAFSIHDPTAVASEARKRAVENARAKADELASAAGMTVRRLVTISEVFAPAPAPYEMATAVADAAGEMSPAPVPIAVGTDVIVVELDVVYELA